MAEVVALWLITLLLIRAVVMIQKAGAPEIILAAVPILFMYMPVLVCRLRGVDSYDYPLALPAFGDRAPWLDALKLNAVVVGIIVVPWVIGYHLWQTMVFHFHFQGTLPRDPLKLVGYHVFFVALPEEFFYRGYLQSRLEEAFGKPWRILGANLGPGWLLNCAIFAAGHSIVQFQWWHFAIFFPSLVFGWMRARTGGVIAGAMFHAWSNVTVSVLDTLYGVVAP